MIFSQHLSTTLPSIKSEIWEKNCHTRACSLTRLTLFNSSTLLEFCQVSSSRSVSSDLSHHAAASKSQLSSHNNSLVSDSCCNRLVKVTHLRAAYELTVRELLFVKANPENQNGRRLCVLLTEAVMEQLRWKQLVGERRELKREKEAVYIKLIVTLLG